MADAPGSLDQCRVGRGGPDGQKIDALRQRLVQAQSEALARQITLQRKIAQVLTPEQRAKAREQLTEEPRRRGERH